MPSLLFSKIRLDRTVATKSPLREQRFDAAYWAKRTPRERLEALEFMRQLNYSYDPDTARLSRLHPPVKRKAR